MVYAPELIGKSSSLLSALLHIERNKLQPYIRALKSPSERHKLPRRAIKVVDAVRKLRKRMIEGDKIDIVDVEKALGEFLDE